MCEYYSFMEITDIDRFSTFLNTHIYLFSDDTENFNFWHGT